MARSVTPSRLRTAALALAAILAAVPPGVASPPSSVPLRATWVAGEVLVSLRPELSGLERAAVHARHGGIVLDRIDEVGLDRVRVSVPVPDAVAAYRADPAVAGTEPNHLGTVSAAPPSAPSDPKWTGSIYAVRQWALTRSNLPLAWAIWPRAYYTAATKPRTPIKVAVLDTRVDTAHRDFINLGGSSTNARSGGQLDLADRKDFVPASLQRGSLDWHGTFIAGLIGASTNNGLAVAGAAYGTQVMPVVVADGNGVVTAYNAARGILHAASRGAKVVNLSFAFAPGGSSEMASLKRAVDRAGSLGAVLVAAAGNNVRSATVYPAAYAKDHPYVIAVAGSGPLDTAAPCSGYNSYVTVAAPAMSIISLNPGGTTREGPCGTSAATAVVTSAAAMIAARYPGITPAAIRTRIVRGADDIEARGRDVYTGAGRLNAQRALWPGGGPTTLAVRAPAAGTRERTSVFATATSAAGVGGAEYFLDRAVPPGKGIRLGPLDGAWGGTTERLTAAVGTYRLAEGVHDLYVRARDRKGVWGPASVGILVVDRTPPEVSEVGVTPLVMIPPQRDGLLTFKVVDPWARFMRVTIELRDVTDALRARFSCAVVPSGRWWLPWSGTHDPPRPCFTRTYTAGPLTPGRYGVVVRATDEAGNTGTGKGEAYIAVGRPGALPTP